MKIPTLTASPLRTLRAALLFAILSSPVAGLAAPKPDARQTALVSALQAVSPDPLGGRLGLVAASARAVEHRAAQASRTEQTASIEADRKAYVAWKNARRS